MCCRSQRNEDTRCKAGQTSLCLFLLLGAQGVIAGSTMTGREGITHMD